MILETDRVKLRFITRDDEANLFSLDSDPEVMRYISQGLPSSKEDVKVALERILTVRDKYNGKFGCSAAIEKATGRFLGWFICRPAYSDPENTKRIEIGYRLKKEYWGRGFATEVTKALINKALADNSIDEVFAVAVKGNLGSQAVMRKSGMSFVKEFTDSGFSHTGEQLVEYSIKKIQGGPDVL